MANVESDEIERQWYSAAVVEKLQHALHADASIPIIYRKKNGHPDALFSGDLMRLKVEIVPRLYRELTGLGEEEMADKIIFDATYDKQDS